MASYPDSAIPFAGDELALVFQPARLAIHVRAGRRGSILFLSSTAHREVALGGWLGRVCGGSIRRAEKPPTISVESVPDQRWVPGDSHPRSGKTKPGVVSCSALSRSRDLGPCIYVKTSSLAGVFGHR